MNKKGIFIKCILVILVGPVNLIAQSPYHYTWSLDLPLAGAGVLSSASGHFIQSKVVPLTSAQIANMNPANVNWLDRGSTKPNNNHYAGKVSDILVFASEATLGSLVLDKKVRKDFLGIAFMAFETISLTDGITSLSKGIVLRSRPYVYHSTVSNEYKMSDNARYSFFSGHTSASACATFFVAKVFNDMNPASKWKIPVWIAAATIPAATALMRVQARQHFITDVAAGYAVGAFFGIFVPELHKSKVGANLSFSPWSHGFSLVYRF